MGVAPPAPAGYDVQCRAFQLEGSYEQSALQSVHAHLVSMVALQMPRCKGNSMPKHVLALLRASPCPVLVYPERLHIHVED